MKPITRAYDPKLDVDEGERAVIATISTGMVDRYGTVIVPKGGDFSSYNENKIVMLAHGGGYIASDADLALPIAKNQWIRSTKDKIVAKTIFMGQDLSPLADRVFKMYQQGFLRAFSISFNPREYGKPTPEELKKNPEWAAAHTIYRTWELLEYSVVAVPANPEALSEAVSRGFELPACYDRSALPEIKSPAVAPALPPLTGRTLTECLAAITSTIQHDMPERFSRALRDAVELRRGRI